MTSSSSKSTNINKRARNLSPPMTSSSLKFTNKNKRARSQSPPTQNRYRLYGLTNKTWERCRKSKLHEFEIDMIESFTKYIKRLEANNETDENYIFKYKYKIRGRNERIENFKKNIEEMNKQIEDGGIGYVVDVVVVDVYRHSTSLCQNLRRLEYIDILTRHSNVENTNSSYNDDVYEIKK
ncbi:hypothetical protein Tco_1323049 [Tanacetum coccineum]